MTRGLSKYACIETVERRYYRPAAQANAVPLSQAPASSCAQIVADKNNGRGAQQLESVDRLRLEVAVSDGREIYSWPGATRFDSRDVDAIIRQGPMGTGPFGTYLLGVFDNPGAEFRFAGDQTGGQHAMLEYRFHVPLQASHYRVKEGASWQPVAYSGSFWLAADSLELQRLTVSAESAPPGSSICTLDSELDYQRVHIGDSDTLLPKRSQLQITLESGRQTNNITTFSDCREYQAESELLFDDNPQIDTAQTTRMARAPLLLPIGLPVTLALAAPIDTETAAAGDLISAKVVQAVRKPVGGVLIPAGATVRGRITRLEHHLVPDPYFLIVLSFNRLEVQGVSSPFAARSEGNAELANELGVSLYGQGRGLWYWGVGTFVFPTSKSRYVVPTGFESKWITLATRPR